MITHSYSWICLWIPCRQKAVIAFLFVVKQVIFCGSHTHRYCDFDKDENFVVHAVHVMRR